MGVTGKRRRARRRLAGWKVTSDSPFWGGILLLISWGSAILLAMSLVTGQLHR
jgi:hypothetical protein